MNFNSTFHLAQYIRNVISICNQYEMTETPFMFRTKSSPSVFYLQRTSVRSPEPDARRSAACGPRHRTGWRPERSSSSVERWSRQRGSGMESRS